MQTVKSSSALYLFLLVAILHQLAAAVSEPHLETLTHLRNTSSSLIIWGVHIFHMQNGVSTGGVAVPEALKILASTQNMLIYALFRQ